MGKNSAIEWTDHTFNPWWGCTKVSEACRNCYAESMAKRTGNDVWGENAERRELSDANWNKPLIWDTFARKRDVIERVFCARMADAFEDRRDLDELRDRLWSLIRMTTNLRWLLLTKRPQNIARMLPSDLQGDERIWLGTTAEDQATANERIPHLLVIPAVVRFVSCEPLLGPVNLAELRPPRPAQPRPSRTDAVIDTMTGTGSYTSNYGVRGISIDDVPRLDWVIVGGESGAGARPMHPDWARDIRDQCVAAGVSFLFKQWGEWHPCEGIDPAPADAPPGKCAQPWDDGPIVFRVGKKAAGRELDGRAWDELPAGQEV